MKKTTKRKKKADVAPGKSVRGADMESSEEENEATDGNESDHSEISEEPRHKDTPNNQQAC